MKRAFLTMFVAIALVGCGDDADPSDSGMKGGGQSSSYPSDGELEREARLVCGAAEPEEVARDFKLPPDSSNDEIAARYARGYVETLRQAAYEGCFEGLGGFGE